jgi:hypothetical protein
MGAKLFHVDRQTDGRTDRHEEADTRHRVSLGTEARSVQK